MIWLVVYGVLSIPFCIFVGKLMKLRQPITTRDDVFRVIDFREVKRG